MSEYLFSYGTLQKDAVQLELFGRKLPDVKDCLRGYKISTVEIKDAAFLARGENKQQQTLTYSGDANERVEGTVLELTKEELQSADNYEPDGYKRSKVVLASGKKVWVYLAAAPIG